jgi:iron complex outermembrane receptor protein
MNLRSLGSAVSLLVLVALIHVPARATGQARDTVRRDTTRTELETVTIRAERATPTTVGGASLVVVPITSLRLATAPVLEDALREMPFVHVRQNSRGEIELTVRGSESRQAAVLLDGVPLTLGWDGRTDPSIVPLGGAGSVVLVRGLSSLRQGPNVLGGVLEIGLNRVGDDVASQHSLALRAGTDQLGSQALHVDLVVPRAFSNEALTLRTGVGWRSRDALTLASDVADTSARNDRRTNSDSKQLDGYVALRAERARGGWAGVTATGYRAERGVPPELHIAEPRLWRYPSQTRALGIVSLGTGRRRTGFGSGDAELVLSVNDARTEIESFESLAYARVVNTEEDAERGSTLRALADHSIGRGELRTSFTLARLRNLEVLDDTLASRYVQQLSSIAAEIEMPLAGTWRATGGAALDRASTPEAGGKVASDPTTEWAGRLGVSALAFATTRVHASISRRARFGSLRELYSGALGRFEPNPALRPEVLVGVEAGATGTWNVLQWQAVVFRHDLEDAIVRIALPDRRFQRVNRDRQRSYGLELLAGWEGERGSLTTDAVIQHARVSDPAVRGRRSERHPEHQPDFRASADLAFPIPAGVRGTLTAAFTGRQYCVHPDLGRAVPLESQRRFDAGVDREYTVRRSGWLTRLRVALGVDNLANAAVFDQCGLPQPGRTFRAAVSLR